MKARTALLALCLAGCDLGTSDEPQYQFTAFLLTEPDLTTPFVVVTPLRTSLGVQASFQAPCQNADLRAQLREDNRELVVRIDGTGCPATDQPDGWYEYELLWRGLESGSNTLRIEHYGETERADGVIYEETVLIR